MPRFKIDDDVLRSETNFRWLSWGAVLVLAAISACIILARVFGLYSDSRMGWLALLSFCGAFFGSCILAFCEVRSQVERQLVFILDDTGITRERRGYPSVRIEFSDVEYLREELGWLIIKSVKPRRKIGVPKHVAGYELICAEVAKHYPVSAEAHVKLPMGGLLLATVSILSWVVVLGYRDLRIAIPAGFMASASFALGAYGFWIPLRRAGTRFFVMGCLALVWVASILVIYFRAARP